MALAQLVILQPGKTQKAPLTQPEEPVKAFEPVVLPAWGPAQRPMQLAPLMAKPAEQQAPAVPMVAPAKPAAQQVPQAQCVEPLPVGPLAAQLPHAQCPELLPAGQLVVPAKLAMQQVPQAQHADSMPVGRVAALPKPAEQQTRLAQQLRQPAEPAAMLPASPAWSAQPVLVPTGLAAMPSKSPRCQTLVDGRGWQSSKAKSPVAESPGSQSKAKYLFLTELMSWVLMPDCQLGHWHVQA